MLKFLRKIIAVLGIGLGIAVLVSLMAKFEIGQVWHLKFTDHFYTRNDPSEEIVIVGIDQFSLSEKQLGRWQNWRRSYYAQVIENLREAGAKVIAVDVIFPTKSQGVSQAELEKIWTSEEFEGLGEYVKNEIHPDDELLGEIIEESDDIVLAKIGVSWNRPAGQLWELQQEKLSIPEIGGKGENGVVDILPDRDGIVRRIPIIALENQEIEENFSLKTLRQYWEMDEEGQYLPEMQVYQVGERQIPVQEGQMLINFASELDHSRIDTKSYKELSFTRVYQGKFDADEVAGKIVLIGATAPTLNDNFFTLKNAKSAMPGVVIQANAIQTVLDGEFLRDQGMMGKIGVILGISLVSALILCWVGIWWTLLYLLLAIAGYYGIASFSFQKGYILNLFYPYVTLGGVYVCVVLFRYFTEIKEKLQLRSAFSHYVSPEIVKKVADKPESLTLGGENRVLTVFFADVEDFTGFSEKSTPEAVISQMNELFEVMTEIIFKNGGTLDKYEGDLVMAFFGAPLPQEDHAAKACQTALECFQGLTKLHQKWQNEGKTLLNFRIGMATGEVIVGNVGSSKRFNYTVMGDTVNTAARLQEANKVFGTRILVSEVTAQAAGQGFNFQRKDPIKLKGKEKAVGVWELAG